MEQKQRELIDIEGVYQFWKDWAQKLEKKDITVKIADFDYTLFSRDEQLENEPGLKDNRWDDGPKFIFREIWMMKFLEKYHKDKPLPQEILSQMNPEYDAIITAGVYEFQKGKVCMYRELDPFHTIITANGKDKIAELIRYVLFDLKFLPKEIIIYEDRPHYFIEHRDLLEDVLECKLTIMYVEMDGNKWYSKIEQI
jgi:hypothetical protein